MRSSKFRQVVGATLVTLGLLTSFAACNKEGQSDDDGNLLVYRGVHEDDIKSLDPANAYDGISLDIVPTIYETLYEYAYLSEKYQVTPLLAADLPKFSADRLTVTIPLRRDVHFQDDPAFKETQGKGRLLKAQDFVYAIKRLALPSVQAEGWWVVDGKIKGINAFREQLEKASKDELSAVFAKEVEGLRAIDDFTLQLKLTKPYPQLLFVLSMCFTSPVAHEVVASYGDSSGNIHSNPVGTGPFVLKKWERGHRVVLDRNPNHHPEFYPTLGSNEFRKRGLMADAGKQLPIIDRISIDVIKEEQPRWLKFLKGQYDLMPIPKDNFSQAITNQVNLSPELSAKGIRLSIDAGVRFYYISFNMKDKLIGSNKALRQAISSAINRDQWIELFTNGRGRKATTALPPGIADRPKAPKLKYDFNLAHAKELLKKAGFPDGKGLPPINFDMRGADTVNRQMGEFFAQQLAAVGIQLNVIYNTFPAYLEKAKQGNLQVSYGGWGMDYPDAENVYQLLYGGNLAPGPNEANFDHPEMNKLYEQLAVTESGPKRAQIVARMDEILQEESPWALGYYHTDYRLTQPWLVNFRKNEIVANFYKYIRINREVKRRYQETRP